MPIKFRCQYCQQYLGISLARAGQLVDCPGCGRRLRVPQADGTAEPIPQPTLDLNDQRLNAALAELASIGSESEGTSGSEPAPLAAIESETPVVLAEPIAAEPVLIEPPLPAVPVARSEPVDGPARPNAQHGEVLAELIGRDDSSDALTARASSGRGIPAAMAAVCTLVAFVAGFLIGKTTGATAIPEPPATTTAAPAAAPAANAPADKPSLKGRITFRTPEGTSRPDRGARVIALPVSRTGTLKLSAEGFRGGDSEADFSVALAGLRALRGDAAVVNDDGEFQIRLPAAGAYHLIVFSNYQRREDDAVVPPELRAVLGEYFQNPGALIGRVRCQHTQIRYAGAGTETWDYSFEPAG